MKKLLVIGGNGLLGNAIIAHAHKNYSVFGTYNKKEFKGGFKLDVTNRKEVFDLIGKIKPDFVIDTHTAHTDFAEKYKEEAWRINVDGTRNVSEACKEAMSKYVFISSEDVFDGEKDRYYETDTLNPVNYYGKTKAISELMLEILDIDHITVRLSFLYGGQSSIDKKSFLFFILEKLRNGKEIDVITDESGSPTLADNAAEVLLRLCEINAIGTFNVVGPNNITKYEFAVLIASKFGLNKNLIKPRQRTNTSKSTQRARKILLDTTKVQKLTGIKLVGVEEGLEKLAKVGI